MEKSLRRAQTISPFGVGSILDIAGESLVAVDILHWENAGQVIREPRLEKKLGVNRFKMAPAAPEYRWHDRPAEGVPYFRFPQWLFCRRCRRMYRVSVHNETGESPFCSVCGSDARLTPMRFVMACPRGHMADVPWIRWAHQDRVGVCENPRLRFRTLSGGSGLEYLQIRCETCDAKHSLSGIASRDSLKSLGIRCTGRQPWQRNSDSIRCDAVPQVLQRGATNLTFSLIESSISIPPYSQHSRYSTDRLNVIQSDFFDLVRSSSNELLTETLIDHISADTGVDRHTIKEIVEQELNQTPKAQHTSGDEKQDLLEPEYAALRAPDRDFDLRDRFIKRHIDKEPYLEKLQAGPYAASIRALAGKIDDIVKVTRLREVRSLVGFSRLGPPAEGQKDDEEPAGTFSVYGSEGKIKPDLVRADLGMQPAANRWLPAIEVYGEGVFLSLDEETVRAWETQESVRQRISNLTRRRNENGRFLPPPTPRLVMLHTLAHILIRQMSFDCGYSLASLRERIYARTPKEGTPMAGILIYTAAGDSEGTLGGLAREADPERLLPSIIRGLTGADWCSSDPVCRESTGQGPGALNLAACHACTLLPETSCMLYNRLLDRGMLVGDIDDARGGFFRNLILEMREDMDQAGGW